MKHPAVLSPPPLGRKGTSGEGGCRLEKVFLAL